jgi:hypothetical protein
MKIILLTIALFVPLAGVASGLAIHNARVESQADHASRPVTMADDTRLSDAADTDADAHAGDALDRLSVPSGPFSVPNFAG